MVDKMVSKKVYCKRSGRSSSTPGYRRCMSNSHERTYLVQCWVHPTSGEELIDRNVTMREFKEFLGHVFTDDDALMEGLRRFEKEVDGFVLKPFFVKTFHEVNDPGVEFIPQIRMKYPEARLASCQEIPNSK